MRHLASVVEVDSILKHDNADLLEIAKIKGWYCVVGKDSFKSGDKGIYFEIDSFIPEIHNYITHRNPVDFNGVVGTRIRTMKLRGVVSQGLLVPLDSFVDYGISSDIAVGTNVTDLLGILKYERVDFDDGAVKGNIPGFIIKTDQERIQNLPLDSLTGDWECTEKLEGASMTVYLDNGVFGVCGRNLEYLESESQSHWLCARKYDLECKLRSLGRNLALQGEFIGPKIQNNIYKLTSHEFRLFDILDLDERRKLLPSERLSVLCLLNANCDNPILVTPDLGIFNLSVTTEDELNDLILLADGYSKLNEKTLREGIVFKNVLSGESFKIISNKYLLKEK